MSTLDFARFTPEDDLTVDVDLFKDSMRHLAGAVSVITVGRGEDRTGFTATSVSSLSIEPPSILVSLNRSSSSWPVLQRYGTFASMCWRTTSTTLPTALRGVAGSRALIAIRARSGSNW